MTEDFMPLLGWDYVELWVGNAKQAAYFYEHGMGFTRTAYAGPETGVRDRASYVLEQGDIRFVLTSALREDHEITKHNARHGDGVRDIALTVPDATEAYRQAVSRGARGVVEPQRVDDEHGSFEWSAIATYGETIHTFVNRSDYAGPFKPGYVPVAANGNASSGVGLLNIDHIVGNVELGRMDYWVEFYERVFGMTNILHFGDEQIHTEYSAQRAGRGQAQEPDRGVHRVLQRRRRTAHRARVDEHRRDRRGAEGTRDDLPRHPRHLLRRGPGSRRRDRRGLRRPAAAPDPRRPRRGRLSPADLHEDGAGPPDRVLRGDRAARRPRLR
jgi:4-hydroxyphenylpyruvate dioxygenase